MKKQYVISIYLDTRRLKGNNLFPVKLRVYDNTVQKTKLYPTPFELSEKNFEQIWLTLKPRTEHKETRLQLRAIETKANEVAKELARFNFEDFEKKLFRSNGDGQNVFHHYTVLIEKYTKLNQIGTAKNYDSSAKSLKEYLKHTKGREVEKLSFSEITPDWLKKYEDHMIQTMKRSRTTVSMYLRALRTIFNNAISDKEIESDIYPFGKKKYQVPAVRNVKKALSKDHLKQLFEAVPLTVEQVKAKDFWFFSYSCSGLNMKDIALLRWENIQDDQVVLYRAKTINTSKADLKPLSFHLNDYTKSIIEKYGVKSDNPKSLIFPIISDKNSSEKNFRAIKNFITSVNKNLKKLCTKEGLPTDISTYWARHSFATAAIRNGASMEFVGEALNHSNLKTTQVYFAGFEDNAKKEFMRGLMQF